MRICIASWAPFCAGAEVAAERLAVGLQEAGHNVLVILGTDGETISRMRGAGLQCEFVAMALTDKWRFWRHSMAQRKLRSIFRRWRPDIVHCNDLPTNQMVGKAARDLAIPRICHHRFPFPPPATDWLNRYGAELHLFVSRSLEAEMCTGSHKLAEAPRAVVHDGIALPMIPTYSDQCEVRKRLGLPLDKVIVLFAGQIVEHKGIADLIHAWRLLPSRFHATAELLIVGDDFQNSGAYRRAMERRAQEQGCRVTFCGFQRNMADWQTAADIAIVPSRIEPLGLVVMEAMALARPVIGCDVGGIPEMIVAGDTGLLVPPQDPNKLAEALQQLIHNPADRQRMGQAARVRCEELFSLEAHTNNIIERYQQVRLSVEECIECIAT